jgi:hypothetical protein
MDLALALWQLNPAAEYRLNDDKTQIAEWRGPGPEPTADELAAAWAQYQAAQQATLASPQPAAVDPAAIGAALNALPERQPLTKADLTPLLALFGAGAGQA